MKTLLTLPTAQAKMAKSAKSGVYLPYILHLAPSDLSGYNTCPKATAGCKAACLNTAGRSKFTPVQKARIAKTKYFYEQRNAFYAQLIKEVAAAERKANKLGKQLVMRLNGTSDLQWENYKMQDNKTIFELFPNVVFYDYTKIEKRNPQPYKNYSLTFSAADGNDADVAVALQKGMNVAVVFRGNTLPQEWQGKKVIDGDTDDLRFLDPQNVVIGLRAKGKATKDTTGFVKDGSYFALPVM
jgi:hypothetical protein